jgi:hypothetical protein
MTMTKNLPTTTDKPTEECTPDDIGLPCTVLINGKMRNISTKQWLLAENVIVKGMRITDGAKAAGYGTKTTKNIGTLSSKMYRSVGTQWCVQQYLNIAQADTRNTLFGRINHLRAKASKCWLEGDNRAATVIEIEINKLLGLHNHDAVNSEINVTFYRDLSGVKDSTVARVKGTS